MSPIVFYLPLIVKSMSPCSFDLCYSPLFVFDLSNLCHLAALTIVLLRILNFNISALYIHLFQKALSERTANGSCRTEIARPKGTMVSIFAKKQ